MFTILPSHVRRAYVLLKRIDVLNQRTVVHYEPQRVPSSPVRRGVMIQCKDVGSSVARSKCHARRWASDERARHRQLEENLVVVRQREVQRCDVCRLLRGRGFAKL